jgi:single-strand DNA-binding protein
MIQFTSFQFIGRLTSDPEMVPTSGGELCKFRVAVNKKIKDEERTSFIPVTVFGKQAEICGKYLTKGKEVFVQGEFETDEYVDKEGNKRTGFGCVVGFHGNVQFGDGGTRTDDAYAEAPVRNTGSVIRDKIQDRGSARGQTRRR